MKTDVLSPEECERIIRAFLQKSPVFLPASSPGLAVRIDHTKAVLEWHDEINPLDLAVWDKGILTIPGPRKFNEKDVQRWHAMQWGDLMLGNMWSLQFGPASLIKRRRPNMIGCIIRNALIDICGKETGEMKWEGVKEAIPTPDTEAFGGHIDCCVWEYDGWSEKHGSFLMSAEFEYPFKCRIGTNGLTVIQPSRNSIIRSFAKTSNLQENDDSYIEGDAQFLIKLKNTFGFSLNKNVGRKTASKELQDRLNPGIRPQG